MKLLTKQTATLFTAILFTSSAYAQSSVEVDLAHEAIIAQEQAQTQSDWVAKKTDNGSTQAQ